MGNIVETRTGLVEGVEESGLVVFRGIPFASPPTGERRFLPPAPMEPWSGVRPAARFGTGAPQRAGVLAQLAGGGDL